jgi:hypothetical protein
VAKRVGAIEYGRRLGAERPQRVATGEQVAHERFATRDELVRQHEPRARLETPFRQQSRELGAALGADGQIVAENDRLSIQ